MDGDDGVFIDLHTYSHVCLYKSLIFQKLKRNSLLWTKFYTNFNSVIKGNIFEIKIK